MTAPKAHINVSGTWKQINKMHVNVSGTWKRVNNAYINVSGTWKKFLASASASSFSGGLGTTGSANTITGTARTYTLGAGNSGQIKFANVSIAGTAFQYSKNGGSFVGNDITEGLTITLANTDTIQLRGTGMTPIGTSNQADIVDVDTATNIETGAAITRV